MAERLLEILESTSQETGAPGVAAIVVSHDAVVAQGAVGVRRLGDDAALTLADKIHTGSNAKAMTATVCAALVAQGQLRWDTTPLDLFPDLAHWIQPEYEAITLEMLLRHMAGIPPYTDDESDDFVMPDWAGLPEAQHITHFARWLLQEREPIHEPGTEFSYSNAGYTLAAAMAEAAAGSTWKDLMRDMLFEPLGIAGVAGRGWPAAHDPDQPWGHLVREGRSIPHPPDDEYQLHPFLAPAGDVCMSLPEYGRFLQMNLKALQGIETILPGELLRRLHNQGQPGLGLGWGVQTLRSYEELGLFSTHAGSAGTFILVAGVSHAHDRAVALATNCGLDPVIGHAFKPIVAAYVGAD